MRNQLFFCSGLAISVLLMACNSVDRETNNSVKNQNKDLISYLFQDTSRKNIKRILFEGGYEGVILETHREENRMFPFKTSHARLKLSLTPDSVFIVSYLFFERPQDAPPDTMIYFLRRDHPENSYYLKKEYRLKEEASEVRVNLMYIERQTLTVTNRNYEKFMFESIGSGGSEFHIWVPDIGIVKFESKVYDKSFVLSFGPDDFRTRIIEGILKSAN